MVFLGKIVIFVIFDKMEDEIKVGLTIENENDMEKKTEKYLMIKKFDLIPKIIFCFIIEMCLIFVYFL